MPRKPAPAVFISYSHKDEAWKDRLVKHLAVLETEELLEVWNDRRIGAGEDWQRQIEEALASARVAVLLITPDFLISRFIRDRANQPGGVPPGNGRRAGAPGDGACRPLLPAGGVDLRQPPREQIHWLESALEAARTREDRSAQAMHLGNLGLAYAALGETRRAIDFYEQQLAIARDIGDRAGEARASWNLGLALEKEGDLARAAGLMQVWLDYEREIGHPDAEKYVAGVEAVRSKIGRSPVRKGRKRGGSSPRGGRGRPGSPPADATPGG